MTEQERQLIQGLATRIQNAPPPQIDREADELIRRSITRPDALYLLVQTVLIQDMAFTQAKAQIDDLKQHSSAPSGSTSGFLPNEPNARTAQSGDWGRDTHVQQPAPQSTPYPGAGYQPPSPTVPSGGGMGGFLRSAATTAAGVIAGETAFSALSSIFGHHGGYGGGSGFLSGAPVSPGSETIVNNYYGDDRSADRDDDRSLADDDDMRSIDDQDDQDDQNTDDSDNLDDSSFDDSGSNDEGSVDV